ncbi:MAG TPA: hypothetical protein VJA94_25285 [Candidatus Angelobacter sp.]
MVKVLQMVGKKAPSQKSILSISYDRSLLLTREWMLQEAGYDVTSTIGFTEAVAQCGQASYDLVIIGHSIPRPDKLVLIAEVKRNRAVPILSIERHGEQGLPEADAWVDSIEGPEVFISVVHKILRPPTAARA